MRGTDLPDADVFPALDDRFLEAIDPAAFVPPGGRPTGRRS